MNELLFFLASLPAAGLGPGFFNTDNLMRPENLTLMVASWGVTEMASRSTRKMKAADLRESILMVLPLALCIVFVFATANWQPDATGGERFLLGCMLGIATVFGHNFAKASGMHDKVPLLKLIMTEKGDSPASPASPSESPQGPAPPSDT